MAIDFTEKLGPLPVWGWGLIGGGVVAVGAWFLNRNGSDSGTVKSAVLDSSGYQTSGISMGGPKVEETPVYDSNSLWLTRAARQTANALSASYVDVYNALSAWITGQAITSDQKKIVDAAVAASGSPPEGTQGISSITQGKTARYVSIVGTPEIYAEDTSGFRELLSFEKYQSLGSPAWTSLLATNATIASYERTSNGNIYAIGTDGTRRLLTPAEWDRLGNPGYVQV